MNNVSRSEVEMLVEAVVDAVNGESVTQQTSVALQANIIKESEVVLDNVNREYESMKRGV